MISHVLPRFWSVGAAVAHLDLAVLTYRPDRPAESTTTFVHELQARDRAALDAVFTQVCELTGTVSPQVFLHSGTPAWIEAELVARDWHIEHNLQLVLPAERSLAPAAQAPIRPARESDWHALRALFRADHEEENHKSGRAIRARQRTDQLVEARRSLPFPVQYFVADYDGIAGFGAGWPGDEGFGLVEDVFVRPDHRGHGLATALIAHAVDWARASGAGSVVIGAEPNDTPKHLYTRLGFTPTEMLRTASPPDITPNTTH